MEIPNDLIHAAFFFVDIVGLSDPSMSTSTQTVKIKTLNKFIKESEVLTNSPAEKLIIMPTGDGMFIGFVDGLEQPLKLAMEIQDKIIEYNRDKHGDSFELLEVRIGCHVGNVFLVEDVSGTQNVWGPGIILARRVMDLGDAGHILLTSEMAEDVIEINKDYEKIIFPAHDYKIKHGQTILLYSLFSSVYGNPKRPKKGFVEESQFRQKLPEIKNKVEHTKVILKYTLTDANTNRVQHTRHYELVNKTDEPMYNMMNGIMTNGETVFNELHLEIFDKNNEKLKIIGINVDTDHSKEFTFKLNEPLFGNDTGDYVLSYQVEEPHKVIENYFFIDTHELEVKFEFPTDSNVKPKIFYKKNDQQYELMSHVENRKGYHTQILWKKNNIDSFDSVRVEW